MIRHSEPKATPSGGPEVRGMSVSEQLVSESRSPPLAFFEKMGYNEPVRSVAQPGSALVWGARCRGFKSRHSDQLKKSRLSGLF